MTPERYRGPTREELSDLADWVAEDELDPAEREPLTTELPASLRAIESELRVLEEMQRSGARFEAKAVAQNRGRPDRAPLDPVLRELDEIEASLRKRPR